jgi:hypothetical protein
LSNRGIKILRMYCLPAVVDAANVLTAILDAQWCLFRPAGRA